MKRWRGISRLNLSLKPKTTGGGYTITEVMIVLSVTTVLFVTVAISFAGRQGRAEFTQAVRNFEAKLESTISEVVNGGYTQVNCAIGASGFPVVGGASNNLGSCIFIGKVYGIYDDSPSTTSTISTLVGRRQHGTPLRDSTTFAQAAPVVAETLDENLVHRFQMRVRRVVSGANRIYAFGFIVPLSGSTSLENDQSAGTKQVRLYGLQNVSALSGANDAVDLANFVELPSGLKICLEGQNGQRAEITVGQSNNQSMLVTTIDTGPTGDCP